MILLLSFRLNNLIAMAIGIIISHSVVLSNISQELKDSYCWMITLGISCTKDKRN